MPISLIRLGSSGRMIAANSWGRGPSGSPVSSGWMSLGMTSPRFPGSGWAEQVGESAPTDRQVYTNIGAEDRPSRAGCTPPGQDRSARGTHHGPVVALPCRSRATCSLPDKVFGRVLHRSPCGPPGRTTLPSRGRGVPCASTRHPRASVRAAATRAGSGIVPKEDIPPRYCAPSDKCAARISDLLTRKKTHPANLDPQDCAPSFPQVTSRPVTERVWLKEQHGPPTQRFIAALAASLQE